MTYNSCGKTCDAGEYFPAAERPNTGYWNTRKREQARLRALSFFLIRTIVHKYGGHIDFDLTTNAINIEVPNEQQLACAQEIEKRVGRLCL